MPEWWATSAHTAGATSCSSHRYRAQWPCINASDKISTCANIALGPPRWTLKQGHWVPGAVERMKPVTASAVSRVPDVVHPRGGLDQIRIPVRHRPDERACVATLCMCSHRRGSTSARTRPRPRLARNDRACRALRQDTPYSRMSVASDGKGSPGARSPVAMARCRYAGDRGRRAASPTAGRCEDDSLPFGDCGDETLVGQLSKRAALCGPDDAELPGQGRLRRHREPGASSASRARRALQSAHSYPMASVPGSSTAALVSQCRDTRQVSQVSPAGRPTRGTSKDVSC